MITLRMVLTETAVLAVFALGLLIARRFHRRWHPAEIIVMYVLGLVFEIMSSHMWNYHHIFIVFPFSFDHDISVLFPLGWAGWIMIVTTLAEALWKATNARSWWARHLLLMGVWLIIGDLSETTFYRIGMIEYVNDARTKVNFLLGQIPGLPPTMILLGYALLPPLFSQYFRWLERSLAEPVRPKKANGP